MCSRRDLGVFGQIAQWPPCRASWASYQPSGIVSDRRRLRGITRTRVYVRAQLGARMTSSSSAD
jgi:hypothetical protein